MEKNDHIEEAQIIVPEGTGTITVTPLDPNAEQNAEDPVAITAGLYSMYWPRLKGMVNNMSNKELLRLIENIFEVPLIRTQITTNIEKEKNAYYIADRLLEGKYIMIMDTYAKNFEQMNKAADEMEVTKQQTQGEVNGTQA